MIKCKPNASQNFKERSWLCFERPYGMHFRAHFQDELTDE